MRWLAVMLLWLAGIALASPNLGDFRDIGGVRVYADHQKPALWYLRPAPPVLATQPDGGPDYALDLYRYMGRGGTGDRALFWARGVLNLELARERLPGSVAGIKAALKAAGNRSPRVRTMPVSGARIRLLFADQERSWEQGARWTAGQLQLPLDEHLAQVVWDAAQRGQTLMSVEVSERLPGMRLDEADEWQEAAVSSSWTLPLTLDAQTYPDRFRRSDLGGQMSMGYTEMTVFCFDFLEKLEPDVYAKLVEVAIPSAGRDLVRQARFDARSDYRVRLHFPLAKDLDAPYRVRVTRVYWDGRRDRGPWEAKRGERLLDVTRYREPEGSQAFISGGDAGAHPVD